MSVVNVRVGHIRPKYQNLQEWMNDPNNLYIGRKCIVFIDGQRYPPKDSPWANPYKANDNIYTSSILELYRSHIKRRIANKEVNLEELRGKNLGCWCKPGPCHGDVLMELLNQ